MGPWWRLKLFSWSHRSRPGPAPDAHIKVDGHGDARASLWAALDRLGLPWRETRAILAEHYGVRAHAAYSWDVVEVPGRLVSALLWPMSVQMLPQFPTAYPAGRFSGAAFFGDDAELNIQRAAEELRLLLGPAPITTQYNSRRCEWQAGAAAVRLTCWPPELQTGRLHNPAHKREPRLVTACHVEVTTGFRRSASPQEDTWIRSARPIGPVRGDRRMRREDVVSLAPYEAEVAFVREPELYLATTYGRVAASADRRALILCHTQLYVVPVKAITAFRVERLSPAKGGGGSWLDVLCETGEPAWPRAALKITSADEPDALNDFGARLAAHFDKPFELGELTPDV